MLTGHEGEEIHAALRAISDDGRVERTDRRDAGLHLTPRFSGALGGRPYELVTTDLVESDADGSQQLAGVGGVVARVPVSVPVRMLVADSAASSLSLSRVPTGDPGFDTSLSLFGAPADVLRAAFDPALRGELLSRRGARLPETWIELDEGTLTWLIQFSCRDEGGVDIELDALRAQLDFALRFAARIEAAFEAVRDEVRAQGGPVAEEAWLVQTRTLLKKSARRRGRNRALLITLLVLVPLLVAGLLILVAFVG
jgi:hypothetical protein